MMSQNFPVRHQPTGLQDGALRVSSALVSMQSSIKMYSHSVELTKHLNAGHMGVGTGVFLMLHADAARKAMEVMKVWTAAPDRTAFEQFDKWLGTGLTCGGTVLFFLSSPFTGGITAALGAMQAVGCVKSAADLVYHLRTGESLFASGKMKTLEVGLDAVAALGTIGAAGFKVGATGVRSLARSLAGRGATPLGLRDRVSAGLSLGAVGLRGVDAVIELTKDGSTVSPPTVDHVTRVLGRHGLAPTGAIEVERNFRWAPDVVPYESSHVIYGKGVVFDE